MTIESYPDTAVSSSATPSEETALLRDRRRRHSFDNTRKNSCDYDGEAVYLRVSLNFLKFFFFCKVVVAVAVVVLVDRGWC